MSTPEAPGAPTNPSNPFGDASAATRAMIDAANTSDVAPTPDFSSAPPESLPPVEATEGTTPDPTQDTGTPMSWDTVDLSALDPDTAKFVQEHGLRHSDYTRKTQELAEQRKQFEQFGDVETVQQAMEFVQNLQDPDFLRQLNADIEAHLNGGQAQTAEAAAPATDQNTSGLDPATRREIEELKAWRAEQVHQAEEAALVDQMQQRLQQSEDSIRQTYPTYTQNDIDAIYKLSPAHNYDLFAAQEQYEEMRKYFTEGLIGNKGGHPDQANNQRSDTLVHQPADMNTMEAAKKATASLFSQ